MLEAEQLRVPGAVHRLEAELAVLVLGDEDVLAELAPVAGGLPEARVVEQRRLDLHVPALLLHPPVERDDLVVEGRPAREPEGRARGHLGEREQPELAAQLAVVARAGLLEALEVRLEVLLGEECGAVDAREHLAVGVAAPVGAGHARELEGLDPLGAGAVRAAAEVGERAVAIQRDGLDALVFTRSSISSTL